MHKCGEGKGDVRIFPDGVNELDQCQYELMERHTNCTVEVLRCKVCGHIDILWVNNDLHPEAAEEECI